jgi:primosomal protein N'
MARVILRRMSTESAVLVAPRFARVVLPIPVEQAFTYEIPEKLIGRIAVGSRVEVPFGRRTLSGIVVELSEAADVPRIRPIHEVHETYVPEPLLRLSRWMASYYGCSHGEALQSVLPPSLRRAKIQAKPTGLARVTDEALRRGGEASEAYAAIQK